MFGTFPFGTTPIAGALPSAGSGICVVSRAVAEVIHGLDFTPAEGNLSFTRASIESIGSAASIAGKYSSIGRIALEVIASAGKYSRGFAVPPIVLNRASLFFVVDPESWATGGQFHLQGAAGTGLTVSGDAATTVIRYSDGTAWLQASITTPITKKLVTVVSGATPSVGYIRVDKVDASATNSGGSWADTVVMDLGLLHPLTRPASGQIAEVMVYNRALSLTQRNYTEAYLWCKWFTPGCNPLDIPVPVDSESIKAGLIMSSPPFLNAQWPDLLGTMAADPAVVAFFGCFGATLNPSTPATPLVLGTPGGSAPSSNYYRTPGMIVGASEATELSPSASCLKAISNGKVTSDSTNYFLYPVYLSNTSAECHFAMIQRSTGTPAGGLEEVISTITQGNGACPDNSATAGGFTCTCSPGFSMYNGKCVPKAAMSAAPWNDCEVPSAAAMAIRVMPGYLGT